MKVLSFNYRGLVSTFKKSSLKRLVLKTKSKVIFFQETMGSSDVIKGVLLSLFPGWDFVVLDAQGRSGGVVTGWRLASCRLLNSWGSELCIGTDVYFHELSAEFRLFNVYGPYLNREVFWDKFFSSSLIKHDMVIVGGDLNFSLGSAESLGPRASPDPLTDFFKFHLIQKDLVDIDPIKLEPTWRNRRIGEGRIAKRLDRFLVGDSIVGSRDLQSRQWVEWGGESDHNPILLEI